MRRLAMGLLLASSAWAQTDGSIEVPVLGLVFDRDAAAIRELTGIPGAARLGPALEGGREIRAAAVAASRGYAVAVDRRGMAVIVSREGARPLPGAGADAGLVAASPSGAAIVLYFGATRTAQVFTGMPADAKPVRSVRIAETVSELAVSDDGEVVLALSRSRVGDTVHAHGRDGGAQVVYRARRIAAIGLVPGSADALVAEPDAVKIVAPDLGEQPAGYISEGDIVAVAASHGGSRVFIASRSGRITIHDVRSSAATSVSCACSPTVFSALRTDVVFRLNERDDGPIWLLDASGTEPRIYFVASDGGDR